MNDSVRLSVRPSICLSVCHTFFTMFPLSYHHEIFRSYYHWVITNDRSDVHAKAQGQISKVKITEVKPQFSRFRTLTSVWIHICWWNDAHSLMLLRRDVLFFFIGQISRSHGRKKIADFDPNWGFPDCNSSLNSPMALKRREEVPYCFSESSFKFEGHTGQKKSPLFYPNWAFRAVTPVCIHPWRWDDAHSSTLYRTGALLFHKVIHQISWSHGTKIAKFDPNWAFPDCHSSMDSPMDLRCTKLDIVKKTCLIVFLDHPSNFKVTRAEKSMIWK